MGAEQGPPFNPRSLPLCCVANVFSGSTGEKEAERNTPLSWSSVNNLEASPPESA